MTLFTSSAAKLGCLFAEIASGHDVSRFEAHRDVLNTLDFVQVGAVLAPSQPS
jgi:hypothetical protein